MSEMLMLVRTESREQKRLRLSETHIQYMQCRPRQKDALLQACSLLAFFMHANRYLPPPCSPRRSVGRIGKKVLFHW
jgi:hypothetical protein